MTDEPDQIEFSIGQASSSRSGWYRPMRGRERDEEHRTATPLELLFDLSFVVAVAFAADNLHHGLSEDRVADGLVHYALVFFGIWWAWMNFTWFASAYDTDDVPYRIATFVQIAGVLILAAGVPRAFSDDDFTITVLGYVVMRLALVPQWLRAAKSDPERQTTAYRYAIAITVLQFWWIAMLALPDEWLLPVFVIGMAGELLAPLWAESAEPTTWHPHHIAERYGLFTLIVLGECILAAATAFQVAFDAGSEDSGFLILAASGLVIVFSMWWLYFEQPPHDLHRSMIVPFIWGYGHYFIFASIAATGAGLQVAVDYQTRHSELTATETGLTVAVPVAIYLVSLWLLQSPGHAKSWTAASLPLVALVVLAIAATGLPVSLMAVALLAMILVIAFVKGPLHRDRPTHA